MSLLEDVFLQDEAGEAQELERIIEGDEYDERPRPSSPDSNDDSEKEDEAEEDKRHVEPASAKQKRVVKNPRVILNPARLTGPRGIQVLPQHFKDFKFKGKGHEKEDLDLVLKKLEHWAYRLFPKFQFEDCLKKIETLGNKRPVMVHLTKIRTDQFMSEDTVVQRDSSDDEAPPAPVPEEDEFDKLLQQQIELARATPAPGSTRKPAFSTPMVDKAITMPKVTSSPSINEEQRERMLRNRRLAEERRLARLKQNTDTNTSIPDSIISKHSDTTRTDNVTVESLAKDTVHENTDNDITDNMYEDEAPKVKNSRANVIDSSDEEDTLVINESVTVDIHKRHRDDCDEEIHKNTVTEDIEEISVNNDVVMNNIDDAADEYKANSYSDIEQHNPNKIEENSPSNNVVINDIDDLDDDFNNDDNIEQHNCDKIEVNSLDGNKIIEKNATSEISSDSLESNDVNDSSASRNTEVLQKQVTGFRDDKTYEDKVESAKGVEVAENLEEDIMDVDFSDDF